MSNMIFYSKRCRNCAYLFTLLGKENLIGYFKLINIDEIPVIPSQIEYVPTMILHNYPKPLVCEEILEWVRNIKFFRGQGAQRGNTPNQSLEVDHLNAKNPLAFDKDIMTGLSDKFALNGSDEALPQSYFGIGDENKHAIFTAPQEQTAINKYDQKRLIDAAKLERNEQDNTHRQMMKNAQLQAYRDQEDLNKHMNSYGNRMHS